MDRPPIAGISGQATRRGQLAASIVIDEEVKLGHALGHADETEALIAQGRPDGNAGESMADRALDPLGKAKLAGNWAKERTAASPSRRARVSAFEAALPSPKDVRWMAVGPSSRLTAAIMAGRKRAVLSGQAAFVDGSGAPRCGEDAAQRCLCRTGTQWLCIAESSALPPKVCGCWSIRARWPPEPEKAPVPKPSAPMQQYALLIASASNGRIAIDDTPSDSVRSSCAGQQAMPLVPDHLPPRSRRAVPASDRLG